jgi:WhiB family redox-sensing transcriptional regulator
MSRRLVLSPDDVARIRRDPRFLRAESHRMPDAGWRARGRCLEYDPELFFPNPAEPADRALDVCRTCAVAGECLATAFETGEVDGVWGGTTSDERRRMRQVWLGVESRAPVRRIS